MFFVCCLVRIQPMQAACLGARPIVHTHQILLLGKLDGKSAPKVRIGLSTRLHVVGCQSASISPNAARWLEPLNLDVSTCSM